MFRLLAVKESCVVKNGLNAAFEWMAVMKESLAHSYPSHSEVSCQHLLILTRIIV